MHTNNGVGCYELIENSCIEILPLTSLWK